MPRNPTVDQFMEELSHPLKDELEAVRSIVLDVSPEIVEDIKWKCPTFTYRGTMASLVVRTKKHVQLMFHKGAILPDPVGLLEGDGKEVRMANFDSRESIDRHRTDIEALVRDWMRLRAPGKRG